MILPQPLFSPVYSVVIPEQFNSMLPEKKCCSIYSSTATLSITFYSDSTQKKLFALFRPLPAIVGKCLVCFSHLVGIITFLNSGSTVVEGIQNFRCKLIRH